MHSIQKVKAVFGYSIRKAEPLEDWVYTGKSNPNDLTLDFEEPRKGGGEASVFSIGNQGE